MVSCYNKPTALLISKNYVNEMLSYYNGFFTIYETDNEAFIKLDDKKTAEDLRTHFRAYLPLDMLIAFQKGNKIDK